MQTARDSSDPYQRLPHAGDIIDGKYVVDGPGRQGEATIVLDARHVPFGERVAIEVLRPEWASHGLVVDRFLRDTEAAMRIRSEHAVRVVDEGLLESSTPYLVHERVDGRSLEEIVARWRRLPVPLAVDCILQAMEAVAQAHSYGVVHGELTASRVFVTRCPDGRWCIKVEFGPRKVTSGPSEEHSGSNGAADPRVDVRALGAMLHFLVTGSPPDGGGIDESLPDPLRRVLEGSLRSGARASFGSVSELARALAPFGTVAAGVSCARIECLLDGRVAELTKVTVGAPVPVSEPRGSDAPSRPYVMPASGRVVLLALAMLATLGALAFCVMYMSMPRGTSHAAGVAEMQGR